MEENNSEIGTSTVLVLINTPSVQVYFGSLMGRLTQSKLEGKAACDQNYLGLDQYTVLFEAIAKYDFTRFVSFTTSAPLTDFVVADDICRRLYRYINSKFYGRQKSQMPYISIVERHKFCDKGKPRLHFHILMGEPTGTHRKSSNLRDRIKYLNLSAFVWWTAKKIRFGSDRRGRLSEPVIERVYNKDGLIDYCLKQIDRDCLHIAWEGTNVIFSKNEHSD